MSPVLYESSLLLIDYWDAKVGLARDLPFDANDDLDHFALDGMMSFVFDEDYRHVGLIPQNKATKALDPASVKMGRNGEAKFPHPELNKFAAAMYGTVDTINATTETFWPCSIKPINLQPLSPVKVTFSTSALTLSRSEANSLRATTLPAPL